MKYFTIILFAVALFSCQNNTPKTEDIKGIKPAITHCYLSAFNNDTVQLQLRDSNNVTTGILNYLPYEKDSRIGNLYDVKFAGDTLFAMYKSIQEGSENICEMAMLKKENKYILTNDIWASDNYKYDSTYTNGKFIAKSKILFNGDTLLQANCQ